MKDSREQYSDKSFRSKSYNVDKAKFEKYNGETGGILGLIRTGASKLLSKFLGETPAEGP